MLSVKFSISQDGKESTRTVNVPQSMEELTARNFVKILLVQESAPDHIVKFLSLSGNQQKFVIKTWKDEEISDYYKYLIDILSAATDSDFSVIRELDFSGHDKSLINLSYSILIFISAYKPKPLESFVHKGQRYTFPHSSIISIGEINQESFGPKMKTGSVIEALQRRMIFSSKNSDGERNFKDGLFYSDLGMIASLCRKDQPNGAEEIPPIGLNEFADFVTNRMEVLSDLPANIFRDCGFFLTNCYLTYIKTLI